MERWNKSDAYRKSLSDIGLDEEQNIQHDELAFEDHSYIATPAERARNEKHWVLSLNKEGVQGPMNQRPDFVEAKREFKRLHDEHVKETSEGKTPIHPVQRTRQRRNQQFEGLEEHNYQVDPRTGWRSYPSKSQGNLRHPTSSSYRLNGSSKFGTRAKVGSLGDPQDELNSTAFFSSFRDAFSLAGK